MTVLEKHDIPGGRARQLKADGFTFDMGPSWYWMPDVFERYFNQFGKSVDELYPLKRLDPSYRVYWNDGPVDIPADYAALRKLFDSIEAGSAEKLDAFLKEAEYKYSVGINKLVHKPGQSLSEFFDWDLIKGLLRLDVFNSMKAHVAKHFSNPKLKELMYDVAIELGVKFHFAQQVRSIRVENGLAKKVMTESSEFEADVVIGAADYHHVETKLLQPEYRSYSEKYWNERVMAPSCLIFYIGLNKKIPNILHHSLFFDTSFAVHGKEIYETKEWPTDPLFYVSATSVTDDSVAPEGCENLFILIPVAAGLENDTEDLRDHYFEMVMNRMEKQLGVSIKDAVVYKRSFAHSDFVSEYHAFKGNAYGLANTLLQTAILKPSCKSKKVKNLFYAGQLTVPGPGVPPSLISGEVVAKEVVKAFS